MCPYFASHFDFLHIDIGYATTIIPRYKSDPSIKNNSLISLCMSVLSLTSNRITISELREDMKLHNAVCFFMMCVHEAGNAYVS